MTARLSWSEVTARRIRRHHLSAPGQDAAGVVAAICGAHAQVLSAGELSVGLRLDGATVTEVRDALWTERTLVKTFGPRGTVHLLPAADLPLWTGALAAVPARASPMPSDAQLTPDQVDAVVEAIRVALLDAELTVDELTEAVVAGAGSWAGDLVMPAFQTMWPRWRQAVGVAANRGALCFGPNRGRKITYTGPSRWLPGFRPADGPAATAGVVRRYLHAYGPATPQHFARWFGAPPAWAVSQFEALGDELEKVDAEGDTAWVVAGDNEFPEASVSGVRLLPYFDAYAVGCHPRDRLFPGPAFERALARGQAGNYPVLLIDGIVAGVWHLRRTGRRLAVAVEPLTPLTAVQRRQLDAEVDRIGAFLDARPDLTIGPVTTGPHA